MNAEVRFQVQEQRDALNAALRLFYEHEDLQGRRHREVEIRYVFSPEGRWIGFHIRAFPM